MSEIILHHYPLSPVSEKVRIALGIKKLAWRSVEIPRVPPKPDVMPLTGGYRRTPIMQIGADIYCDSQCILRELERQHPNPTFFPGGSEGFSWMMNRWTDGLFDMEARLLIGSGAGSLPEAFLKDRGRLFFGPDWKIETIREGLPHTAAQLRVAFALLDRQLADGRRFIAGDQAGLMDATAYYLVWFIRPRWEGGPALIGEFAALEAWEQNVKAIGHGSSSPMTSGEAIEVANSSKTATPERADKRDPQGLKPGMRVTVAPDLDSGEEPVAGIVRAADTFTVSILRDDPRVGTVCVHFPRTGYRVRPA
ncbi:MAG: glutathione S-transferase family protein [Burkholderiales bacterium]